MFSKNFYNVIQNHDVLSTYLIKVEMSLRLVWRREKIKYISLKVVISLELTINSFYHGFFKFQHVNYKS
jgi:hypothetical protein